MTWIACDLDGTLVTSRDREHLLPDWEAFHRAGATSSRLIPTTAMILAGFSIQGFRVLGLTGRNERWRFKTLAWLARKGVVMHELIMRADDDYRKAAEFKLAAMRDRFGDDLVGLSLVIDDSEVVVSAFQELGVAGLIAKEPMK